MLSTWEAPIYLSSDSHQYSLYEADNSDTFKGHQNVTSGLNQPLHTPNIYSGGFYFYTCCSRKSSSKSCLTLFLKRGCGRSPFNVILNIWQLLRWIWRLLNVFICVHCICRSSMPQEPHYNFRLHLRVGEQILLSHVFPQLHALHHFFIFR